MGGKVWLGLAICLCLTLGFIQGTVTYKSSSEAKPADDAKDYPEKPIEAEDEEPSSPEEDDEPRQE